MNAIELDRLPYLCLERIFQSLPDLARCRAMSRRFYEDAAKVNWLFLAMGTSEREFERARRIRVQRRQTFVRGDRLSLPYRETPPKMVYLIQLEQSSEHILTGQSPVLELK